MTEAKIVFTVSSKGDPQIYALLAKSFPDFTPEDYNKVNNGKYFRVWRCGEINGKIVCCTAMFYRDYTWKMGLFCVDSDFRRQGIGTTFFKHIASKYNKFTWGAVTEEAIAFYTKLGAKKYQVYSSDGKRRTKFTY